MRRNGFTLIELIVAMTISGVVLLGARALWESLTGSVDRLRAQSVIEQRNANSERLLRSLVGRLEVGTDQAHEFSGEPLRATFTTWCNVPAGWLERCDADLAVEADSGTTLRLVARLSTGEVIVLRRGFETGALRYLNDPLAGGVWFRVWSHGITAPLAIGVITGGDTTILRIGARG